MQVMLWRRLNVWLGVGWYRIKTSQVRYLETTGADIAESGQELEIHITTDPVARTLTIQVRSHSHGFRASARHVGWRCWHEQGRTYPKPGHDCTIRLMSACYPFCAVLVDAYFARITGSKAFLNDLQAKGYRDHGNYSSPNPFVISHESHTQKPSEQHHWPVRCRFLLNIHGG